MDREACKNELEQAFFANTGYDDIVPKIADFGKEYYDLESKLASTYTPEQMELSVALEVVKENVIIDIKKSYYKRGYNDAMIFYSETVVEHD